MTTPAISLQLYAVNAELEPDLDAGIARLAEIGLTNVEAFAFVDRATELRTAFDAHGIVARTGHAFLVNEEIDSPDGTKGAVPSHADTFAAAKELGLEIVIDPFVPASQWQTRADVEHIAARLNEAAAEAAEHGLRVGYHNHDHEFRATIDGATAYDLFVSLLDPSVVLEVDLYWASAAGQDIVALLRALGDRVVAVHVKDGPMREGISTDEMPTDQKPAGQGDVRLAEALDAAGDTVRFAVIEFDHFDGDVFDGVAQSFAWLSDRFGSAE